MEIRKLVIYDKITNIVIKSWPTSYANNKTLSLNFDKVGWSIDTEYIYRDSRPRLSFIIDITWLDFKLPFLLVK